jgi:lipid II:glycine glycyltransferase (peptidoglycan interpeptide bridge formation enzyme)
MYIPKGPALDYDDAPLLQAVLADLEGLAREQRGLFLKLDPDVPVDTPSGERVVALLEQRGWRSSREQIQFRNTSVIDLKPSPDDILSKMKSKWRYNIRLAKRRDVTVRLGTLDDLPLLYEMYEDTSQRQRFVIRPESYYEDAWGSFIRAGLAQPLIAQVGAEPVAMVILFRFGQLTWYMYGGSRTAHRERMPNHLLQWEAMLWARSQGCKVYDMWGAPDMLDGSDPMAGVHRFKMGFGAKLVRHIGAYDYPTSRRGYWFYTVAVPRILALMRWRHWQSQPGTR